MCLAFFLRGGLAGGCEQFVRGIPAPGRHLSKFVWFNISSVDTFEQNLETAHWELGIELPQPDGSGLCHRERRVSLAKPGVLPSPSGHLPLCCEEGARWGLGVAGEDRGRLFSAGEIPARVLKYSVNVWFADVAGCEEARLEMMGVCEFPEESQAVSGLRSPNSKGGAMPTGLLALELLLVTATAGKASVPFITVNGSEFLETFVGIGPARWKRGRGHFGSQSDRENTLNQMLVEGWMGPDIKGRLSIFTAHLHPLKLGGSPCKDARGAPFGLSRCSLTG
ncbi:AFG3-like protein 2 [Prionailurus iriomotensis]